MILQKRNVTKKLNQINGTIESDGQMAVIMPTDLAYRMIKKGDAKREF